MAATNKRGVFSLEKVLERQSDNNWSNIFDPFRYILDSSFGTDYGYFGGGTYNTGGSSSSIIQRIDFNNDTANSVTKGNETVTAQNRGGTSSTSYGYLGGGNDPAYVSTVDRVDYSNDTATASAKGPLTLARARASGTHNSDYGYQGGGYKPASPNWTSTVDRIDFSNDTSTAVTKGPLTGTKNATISVGDQSYGYWAGGNFTPWPTFYSSVDRLDYSSDTTATAPKGNITRARAYTGATGNASYGYIGAGYFDPGPYYGSTMDRIDYSNDTATASPAGPYIKSTNAWNMGATGNTSYGYWAGDERNYDGSEIGRLDYSNDTATALEKGKLSGYMQRICGFSSRANANPTSSRSQATRIESHPGPIGTDYAYTFGGYNGSYISSIQKIDFSNDTATAPQIASLPNAYSNRATVGNSSYAWVHPGYPPAGTNLQRFDYSNDTSATTTKGSTPEGRSNDNTGTENFGYFQAFYPESRIFRLDYANDTSPTVFKVNRSVSNQIYNGGAASNSSYGYFAGGGQNGTAGGTTMDRIDYSNDTAALTQKGPLTSNQTYGIAATGSANYAYWSGGTGGSGPAPGPRSTTDRLDYSNDTSACVTKGPLTSTKYLTAATGNRSFGYWTGGQPGGGQSDVDRLDYSSDTTAMAPKGPLTHASYSHSSESSRANALPTSGPIPVTVDKGADGYLIAGPLGPAYGYVSGGKDGHSASNNKSFIQRIDFGNDTAIASSKGPLSSVRAWHGASSSTSYGYFAAGIPGNGVSTVDRLDFASDSSTATQKGNLSLAKRWTTSVGNNSYSYVSGGHNGSSALSSIDRIDFADDTSTASPKGTLSVSKQWPFATGNQSYGYVAGGEVPAVSIMNRIDYSSDTGTTPTKGPLTIARYAGAATGNASYGYFGGGNPGPRSTVDRLDYSSDTTTTVAKGPLNAAKNYLSATGSQSYGYFSTGFPHPYTTNIDRVDFANDTATATPKGNLVTGLFGWTATGAQSNALQGSPTFIPRVRWVDSVAESTAGPAFGYFGGGYDGSAALSIVDRIDYSNDSATAAVKGPLSIINYSLTATGNASYGYFGGGYNPSAMQSSIHRIDYADDTSAAAPKGLLSGARSYMGAAGNSSYGYFGGGYTAASGSVTTVERIDYNNDTATAAVKGPLSLARYALAATGNASFGYFGGGQPGPERSTVDRIDYSNDTGTTPTKGPLSSARRRIGATGNASYGYFGGGFPGPNSTVDRIDYANDTAIAAPKGPLSLARFDLAATGNASFGYSGGGNPKVSTVDRIDFNNDTAVAAAKGPLSSARFALAAASAQANGFPSTSIAAPVQPPFPFPVQLYNPAFNLGYGYFAGGYDYAEPSGPTADMTLIQRIDFTNDTATALLKGNLSSSPGVLKSTSSNKDYGYIVGGNIVPSVTRVDRLDYTNDTATTSVRGPITDPARGAMAGAGNNDYGWHTGGIYAIPSRTVYSKVDRIDYANDSSTASPKGNLAAARGYFNATGTLNYGYFAAGTPDGQFGPNSSTVQRIDYGNDTAISSPKGPLSRGTSQHASTGNANYGWFIGGYGPNSRSKIDRIDYASDTAVASVRGPLYQPSYRLDGTGNSNYGYVHPGLYPGNPAGPGGSTEIARIDYSNDTITTGIRGHFARSMRIQESAFSAAENGRS